VQTSEPSLDSVFVNWNKSTLGSLNRQMEATSDSLKKSIYSNRVLSLKEYWAIKSMDDLNRSSIRYKFLKTAFAKLNDKTKDFYIIEANESGSKVLLKNFILFTNSTGGINVEFYDFFDEEWKKKGTFKEESFNLQSNLRSYLSSFGKGVNSDDIIITKFRNANLQESEYYLYTTLSSESKIKKILEGYKNENFIQ
jgi:hypothetical protein